MQYMNYILIKLEGGGAEEEGRENISMDNAMEVPRMV